MSHIMMNDIADGTISVSPEEQLKRYVTEALQESGYPPLQYLEVETRDGHVYLSARVPTLFLTRLPLGSGLNSLTFHAVQVPTLSEESD